MKAKRRGSDSIEVAGRGAHQGDRATLRLTELMEYRHGRVGRHAEDRSPIGDAALRGNPVEVPVAPIHQRPDRRPGIAVPRERVQHLERNLGAGRARAQQDGRRTDQRAEKNGEPPARRRGSGHELRPPVNSSQSHHIGCGDSATRRSGRLVNAGRIGDGTCPVQGSRPRWVDSEHQAYEEEPTLQACGADAEA